MKTAVRVAAALVAAAGSVACIRAEVLVKVQGNGSGTVEKSLTMNPEQIAEMAKEMQATGARSAQAKDVTQITDEQLLTGPFDPEGLKQEAARMGEGVTFVSATPVREKDRMGVKAVFAFKDVNALRINQKLLGDSAPGARTTPEDDVRFTLTKQGGNEVLKVRAKGLDLKSGSPPPKATPPAGMEQMAQGMFDMVKPMLKGLRFTIGVEVDGTVVKTNSAYAEGNRVTYLDLDFGALLSDEKALRAFGDDMEGSLEQQKAALSRIKGMKVHLEPELVIEFKPR